MRAKNTHRLSRFGCALSLVACLMVSVWSASLPALADSPPSRSTPPFVAKLRPLLIAEMKNLRVPGAIVYINYPAQGSWTSTMGTSNLATGTPMSVNDHMRVGSITKTFTATVILQLVDKGKLRLDDPVSKYFSQVPNGSNITLREVLQMTSGLFNYSDDQGFETTFFTRPHMVWNPWELLAIAFKHQPYFAPGQGLHYSNTNYILLGLLIEKITHMPVAKVFQERIFKRLNMNSTSLPPRSSEVIPSPYAHGYLFETSNAPALTDVTFWNPSWGWTAGSAISTLHDMKIWAKALATGTLLSPATQRERLIFRGSPGKTWLGHFNGYGLGIVNFGGVIGHNGTLPGFQSFVGYYPQKGVTIVVLTNLYHASDGTLPANALEMIIQEQLQLFS